MRRRQPSSGGEALAVAGLLAVMCALGLVWLWGGTAGWMFGSGWPRIPAGDLLSVLVRLPTHLSHPQQAWPPAARRDLPAGLPLLGCLILVVGTSGLAGAGALRAWRAVGGGAGGGGARWASGAELRPLRMAGPWWPLRAAGPWRSHPGRAGRLALGRHRGRVLYGEERHALVAFGPPQSGKSAGLAIPALLEWEGPAIASSIKTDLLAGTARRRQELGEALIFDPFQLSGQPGQTWSPLRLSGTWEGALEVAWRLTSAAELDSRGVEGGDFWAVAAEQRLAPLLFAAARSGSGIERVVSWVYGQDARGLDEALDLANRSAQTQEQHGDALSAYAAVRAFQTQADRTRSSIEATAQTLLRAYRFARVARSAAGCEITPERLLHGPNTLYLIGDAKASKLLRPIFLALLSEVIDAAYAEANAHGGRLPLPLLVCLDEAGNVAPLPSLAEIASTAPSHNIQLLSIFHDMAQARSRYGQQAETVVNSHRARMLLPGVADLETLRYFSGLVGEEETLDLTRTTGSGGSTRSHARRRRPLIAPEELRQLPDGWALLLYGRLAPTRIRLRRWFEDRRLRRLAAGEGGNGA